MSDPTRQGLTIPQRSLLVELSGSSAKILRVTSPGVWSFGFAKQAWSTRTVQSLIKLGYLEAISEASCRLTEAGRERVGAGVPGNIPGAASASACRPAVVTAGAEKSAGSPAPRNIPSAEAATRPVTVLQSARPRGMHDFETKLVAEMGGLVRPRRTSWGQKGGPTDG